MEAQCATDGQASVTPPQTCMPYREIKSLVIRIQVNYAWFIDIKLTLHKNALV